jgi:hypothetical protein
LASNAGYALVLCGISGTDFLEGPLSEHEVPRLVGEAEVLRRGRLRHAPSS